MTSATGPAAQPPSVPRVAARDSGWRWLPLAALIIALDQWTKGFIERHFELYQTQFVLPVLDIVRAHNKGAAFSFLADAGGWQRWVFTALALGVSATIVWWLRGIDARSQPALAAGLALIQGGAIGNVIDRIEHGYVVDFIQVHWAGAYFPAFNVADSAITVGAGLLILDAIIEWRRERARAAQR